MNEVHFYRIRCCKLLSAVGVQVCGGWLWLEDGCPYRGVESSFCSCKADDIPANGLVEITLREYELLNKYFPDIDRELGGFKGRS